MRQKAYHCIHVYCKNTLQKDLQLPLNPITVQGKSIRVLKDKTYLILNRILGLKIRFKIIKLN